MSTTVAGVAVAGTTTVRAKTVLVGSVVVAQVDHSITRARPGRMGMGAEVVEVPVGMRIVQQADLASSSFDTPYQQQYLDSPCSSDLR